MTNTDFHARRTALSNTFAAAGAQLLDYMRCAGALAAIPNTQQYVVAGDIAAVRAQLDTVAPQRRMRHGDRPEQPLYFGPEAGQARRWAALITSAGHGVLQEYGSAFEHAQPGQEVLEVMEILPGSSAIANKAEVEPVGVIVADDPVHGWHMHALKPWNEIGAGAKLYVTTPATTGASTEELKRDAERHRYTRATTTAVRDPESGERIEVTPEMYDAAIDRAIADDPDFSKGIKSRHLVGASTVLTDERIEETITMKRSEYLADRDACFQRGKEEGQKLVAAQAGQVAGWMNPANGEVTSAANKKQMESAEFGRWKEIATRYTVPLLAPSPAKESK